MSIRKTKKRESFATNAKSLADDEENEEDTNKISDIYEDKKEKVVIQLGPPNVGASENVFAVAHIFASWNGIFIFNFIFNFYTNIDL